jgi:Holliday junction resolvasome RuvABC DNA-binding subunit
MILYLRLGEGESNREPEETYMQGPERLVLRGYSNSEARRAVDGLEKSPDLTLEDRVRLALQRLGGGG